MCVCGVGGGSVHREPSWLSASGEFNIEPQRDPEDRPTEHPDTAERAAAGTQQHPVRHTHTHTHTHTHSHTKWWESDRGVVLALADVEVQQLCSCL